MNKIKKDAEVFMSVQDFKSKFPVTHMRRPVGDMQIKVNGFYAFLDPSNGKRTFVS
jgi:hypothetical protein